MEKTNALKMVLWALVSFALLFTAACQATPDANIVINKGDNILNEKIAQTAISQQSIEAPSTWQDTITDTNRTISIVIDADVNISGADHFAVAEIQKETLTTEWTKELLAKLGKGKPLLEYRDETFYTKSDIEQMIINAKQAISDPTSDINTAPLSSEERNALIDDKNEEIKQLEEAYKNAPDEFNETEKEVEFSLSNTGSSMQFFCGIDLGKMNRAYVSISKPVDGVGGYVVMSNFDEGFGYPISFTTNVDDLNSINISKDAAINLGTRFIESLDQSGFEPSLILAGYMQDSKSSHTELEEMAQCYTIYFTRSVEGVPTTYRNTKMDGFLMSDSMKEKAEKAQQYAPFWPQESIELCITDSGIDYMRWEMPTQQTKVLNTNVELLPFDEIQERFKKQILIEGLWTNPNDSELVSRKITISHVKLGMMQVRKKDSYDGLIMIPAWNFYGSETYQYSGPLEGVALNENYEYVNDQLAGHSFLTINAIDGSIINPILGY